MSLQSVAEFFHQARKVRVERVGEQRRLTGSPEEQKAMIDAGEEAVAALCMGVAAVGELLTMADVEDKGTSNDAIERLGWFLVNVGELAYAMHETVASVRDCADGQPVA